MKRFAEFETPRLRLRLTDYEDAAFLLELLNTPKWLQYIGDRNVYDLDSARVYIQNRVQSQYDRLGFAGYTLIRKSDQQKLGCCGLYNREGLEGIDLGFALLPQYEGQGYGSEAAGRLKEAAFAEIGLPSLCAITTKDNLASQGLLRKLGFQFDQITQLPDDPTPLLYLTLNAPDP
ncbi:MAG TPA: GNAT family N-acetyltransferase [Phaeodactylibacter sp.]|nr:GNAT family N-acetyltransferase [Phaeodactylibacter sp.]